MNFIAGMQDAASDYAADLRKRGYTDVGVFRYDTLTDNREPYRRDHLTASGYAVRYTSDAATDARVWAGSDGERKGWPRPKFHDRSVTVFVGENDGRLWHGLTNRGGIIADFAGEEPAPMYTAAWSPADGPHAPLVPSVIMKRFAARKAGDRYPWQIGPTRFYHLIMTPPA
jgi:hypothetical protein